MSKNNNSDANKRYIILIRLKDAITIDVTCLMLAALILQKAAEVQAWSLTTHLQW